ncbi:MarR family winged helix-turn-helix transcriptional regulator [Streptomyces sp. NBC_00576]|uniref:MarR family winged helix-turn-helix transcriptional regulator n=1 Tax=Streptomyces sp. NBC_00576 TaxID=2903665 RepID=UPI002E80D6B5|nr:MarR family transcriptional regulator [Streptomyces sp. NBC_00576]WUB76986.1 MarR family transcriptional regulator [Streptomyces sp. NBC_00576]
MESRIGDHIKRVEQELTSARHAALRPLQVNVPQYTVLRALQREPGLSGAALARRSMVTPQTMSSVLSNLEGRGLVERRPHPIHQHILEARLTRAGHTLVRRADEVAQEIEDLLTNRLGEDEAKSFLTQLDLCSQALAKWQPRVKEKK